MDKNKNGTHWLNIRWFVRKSKVDFGSGNARYVTFLGVLENVILNVHHTERVHVDSGESQNSVMKGDLLFNASSKTLGDLAIGAVMGEQLDNLYLNSLCFGFRIHDKDKYIPLFLAYFFRGNVGREIMNALAQGATRYNISKNQFRALELSIPSGDEQRAITAILSDMDAEIAALEQRRDKTHIIKQRMMQQLLTGRVRLVKKKYTKMLYQKSPYFETPPKCKKIWRYMPIDKFMAMLSEESLYFPNVYSFDDRYEGLLSDKTRAEVYKTNLLNENNTPVKQDDGFNRQRDVMEKLWESRLSTENEMKYILNHLHSFQALLRDFSNHLMFCSSWFLNKNESHSMWAEYGDKRSPTSVAIQTTVGDLIQSFESTSYQIHIGKVKYKDYNEKHIEGYEKFLSKDLKNPNKILQLFYAPILHKRDIYKDEKEVRAIISFESICKNHLGRVYASEIPFYSDQLFDEDSRFHRAGQTNIMKDIPKGISVKINLQTLLKAILISPNANEYFYKPLIKLIKNYDIDPSIVRRSAI